MKSKAADNHAIKLMLLSLLVGPPLGGVVLIAGSGLIGHLSAGQNWRIADGWAEVMKNLPLMLLVSYVLGILPALLNSIVLCRSSLLRTPVIRGLRIAFISGLLSGILGQVLIGFLLDLPWEIGIVVATVSAVTSCLVFVLLRTYRHLLISEAV